MSRKNSDVHYTQGLMGGRRQKRDKRKLTGHNKTTPWGENMEDLVHLGESRGFQGLITERKKIESIDPCSLFLNPKMNGTEAV